MELPLGGPALRHYTQSRPRPHRQKLNYRPSRPQETIIESENEVLELMGRVDEGVEEFFTKRVLPADTLKKQDEESITVHEVAPASSVPCPPPTKTLRRKLGDFFTLRKRRGLKSETSQEGRPKKASIADLIRPLREVARAEKEKDKERVKEHDKENEKEKAKEHPGSGESAVQETPVSGAPTLRGEAVPPRRALREGKSQSLILLSGSSAAGTTNARNTAKKQLEGQHSFEQKLHLMLQRIGVSKAQPGETQNQEGEMKKAESEGTIIDSKPEPPPTFTKPRTMSASSDTRHQIRPSASAHESAGKPALLPKPVIKPGPPPTSSGRNTPENELAQIQEGEANTPTKLSPTAAPPATTTAPAVPTISDSVPDSANVTVSPSSTVSPPDSDICTDSVNAPAGATTPTDVTKADSKPLTPEASVTTTEPATSISPTTLTSTTPTTEPPAAVSVTSTPSEYITPSLSVTSTSTTITSVTTSETVSAPGDESSASKMSSILSAELISPETNGILSVGSDAAKSVIGAVGTSASDSSTRSVTVASDEFTSVLTTSSSSVTLVLSDPKAVPPHPNSSDTIKTPVSADASVTISPISAAHLPTSTTSSTTTTSPTSTNCMTYIPPSTITHPAVPSTTDISVPSTSSSGATPTGTTTTTTTAASLTTAAAVRSPVMTDSDRPDPNNTSTTLTPTVPGLPATDNSSATSHHFTSPAPSIESPLQDNDLQTPPEEKSSLETAVKGTDEEIEMVQKSKQAEKNESKTVMDSAKESEKYNEKPAEVSDELTKKEVQEESVKPEEVTVTTEVATTEPESGKVGAPLGKEEVIEGQNREETKAVDEK